MKDRTHYQYCQDNHNYKGAGDLQFVPESSPRHYSPDTTILCQELKVDLNFKDLTSKKADSKVNLLLKGYGSGSNTIVLNAVADSIKISQIKIDDVNIDNFSMKDGKLIISYSVKAEQAINLTIDYIIDDPKSGLYWILPDPSRPQRPNQIWTQGESEEARYWLPCIDSPLAVYPTRFTVTVPKGNEVISNGKLLKREDVGENSVFDWFQELPHPSYLITLCIGKFASYEDEQIRENTPLRYYADAGQYTSEDLHRSFKETPQMIKFLSRKLGVDYPWVKYYQTVLEDFMGAMENTSATSWYWSSLLSQDEYETNPNPHRMEEVNLHELAHQWFGDLVVIRSFDHAFLKEGMVTYLTSCYLEEFYGKDFHFMDMYDNQEGYLKEFKKKYARPIVYNKYDYSFDLYDGHIYPGGAWRFHMIRRILGDDLWWKTLNHYLTVNRHKAVETSDFIKALDEVTGKNFREFFDDWIFRPGVPNLSIQYKYQKDSNLVVLNFEQTQALIKSDGKDSDSKPIKFDYDKLFNLSFQIAWLDKNKSWHRDSIKIPKSLTSAFSFPVTEEPIAIYINSNLDILMEYSIKGLTPDMYKNQAEFGPDALSRYLALVDIVKTDFVKESEFINKIASAESGKCLASFKRMIKKIAETKSPLSFRIIKNILNNNQDNLPIVASIITLIGKYQTSEAFDILFSFINHKNKALSALAIKHIGSTQFSEKVLPLLKEYIDKPSWEDRYSISAAESLGSLHEPASDIVILLANIAEQSKYHFMVRFHALQGISNHSSLIDKGLKTKLIPRLEVLLSDDDEMIKMKSASVLSNLKSHSSRPLIEMMINMLPEGDQVRMKRLMKNFGKDEKASKELSQLRKEMVEISRDNKELREKLQKLEAVVFAPKEKKD
ncbi:MAG: M1 family aminopeptidase [Candidatus Hodarchaeales archaeon]|jgi:aminopeptidase N